MKYYQLIKIAVVCFIFAWSSCSPGTDNKSNTPGNSSLLTYGSHSYSIAAGLEEVYDPDLNHSNSELSITDGEFYSTQVVISGNLHLIWRARNASVWLYVKMYSPGTTGFRAGAFDYVPSNTDENDPSLAQQFFFKNGRFVVDRNSNGDFEDNEYLDIMGGRITISGSSPDYIMTFELTVDNGMTVSGSFSGKFPHV